MLITLLIFSLSRAHAYIHSAGQDPNKLGDVSYFNCKDKARISRFPDSNDCFKYIYCISGTPHSAKCWPVGARFNPDTSKCDLPPTSQCGPLRPTTTPPTIMHIQNSDLVKETFQFSLDCGAKNPCGIYPNHNKTDCKTFILCTERGQKVVKHCNGGQLFDVNTQECHPKEKAKCWEEPNSGPFIKARQDLPELCAFHNFNSSLTNGSMILSNPVVTNWGEWTRYAECPNGTYARGINAWRRLLQAGLKIDHAGLISLAIECVDPNGIVKGVLESIATGAPNDGFPSFYRCGSGGTAVGFRLNSQAEQGHGGDNLATDNIELICSCGPPVHKPYETIGGPQSGNRGDWTEPQYCGQKEAICGVQTQMLHYKEGVVGSYDNTGLNNVRMKCCPVPNPAEECDAKQDLELIRSCKNSQGIYPQRCDFQFTSGLSYSLNQLSSANFHQSVGFNLDKQTSHVLTKKFKGSSLNWDGSIDNSTWISKSLYIQTNTSITLHQVIGTCGHFLVRSNTFLREVTDLSTGNKTKEYFYV